MIKPANSKDKPSPADTPTERPKDNGGKSIVREKDKQYKANQPEQKDIALGYENGEQPVTPIKDAPKE